ncbi:glucosamine inositolphosphorylceramide transferase family protein, partial [Citrobacter cronae]|uniref:glucosamine inositolphosphorylceramide transferase family protein n=1 Tax=Citrobacter cronae TaxID=1748967 RepID=UPI00195E1644
MQTKIKKIIKTFFYHESWDIMILKDHGSHLFPDNTLEILSKTTAQQLKKKYTFQADPFIVEKADKLYVFYEAFSFRNSKGTLRCRVLDRELTEIDDVKLEGFDDLRCHLSFPFLIHINDQLFMIPESSERKEVILFQSVEFPARWKKIKVLISDTELTDNVFLTINETCYLLSTTMDNEIIIHSAENIFGEWQRIAPSLKVSNHHHRGAGAPYLVDNKMYFLTQECTPETYGKSIYIKELVALNDTVFDESLIEKINSSINHSDGVHTLNFSNNYIVYDSKINKFSL